MSNAGIATALLGLLLISAAPAWAASEEGGGVSWRMLALHVLNFGVLLWLLWRYARLPIVDFVAQRSKRIRREIEAADERLRAAEREIEELRARLAHFDREAEELVEATTRQAEIEGARVVERAEATALRIREDAERVANQEIERARQTLRVEAAELATELAAGILSENLTPGDDERLVSEFIERVGDGQRGSA